jgi:hypothetical protein
MNIHIGICEDFILFYIHNTILQQKEIASCLIKGQIERYQEVPLACSTQILLFLVHLLRNITADIQQIHHLYFMKILYLLFLIFSKQKQLLFFKRP